jgi:hypothetical protein
VFPVEGVFEYKKMRNRHFPRLQYCEVQ